jgi:TatD DNase family protein
MFVDSHAHIDGQEFDADRDDVIQRARDAGVVAILNVATGDPHTDAFTRGVSLAEKHPDIYAAIGVHPHDARLFDATAEKQLINLQAESSRIIAWGEIGLDFHYDNSPREVQLDVFRRQLRIARELHLPVIIHTREAETETIEILESEWASSGLPGIMHCFSGSLALAKRALGLGFFISFSGIITFKKAEGLRAVAREVPLDKLLIETDCPYLAPVPFRGKRNEPSYVVEVARCLANLHHTTTKTIAGISQKNFSDLFGLVGQLTS